MGGYLATSSQAKRRDSFRLPAKTHANTNVSRRIRGSHIHFCGCITDIRQSAHQSFFKDLRAAEARHPSWRRFPCIQVRGAHTSDRRPSSIKMPKSPTVSTSVLPNLFAKLRLGVSARQPHREVRPHSAGVLLPDGLLVVVCATGMGGDSAAFSDHVAAAAALASPLFVRASKLRPAVKDLGFLDSDVSPTNGLGTTLSR